MNAASMNEPLAVREAPASYVLDAQRVRPGYKQTEVGVIPEDWEVVAVRQCLKIRHGKSQREVVCTNGEYPILATGGEIGRASRPLYSKPSVLIGRKGTIDVPRYIETPFWSVDTLFYSEVAERSNPKFMFYQFCMVDWYSHNEASGVPSLNAKTIENIQIALPPTKAEQEAIAGALSDADALIESLEQLIAKKRHLKQGAMQELLTGKKRLPRFSGEWEVKRLGELFEITSSKRVFQREWKSEGIPFYRARELAVLGETDRVDNELFITRLLYESFRAAHGVPEVGDMLVTGVGTLGKVYVVRDEQEFYFKDGNIIWFKIRGKVSAEFLRQLYLTKVVMKQITDASAGTTVGTYTISGAKKTEIPFPPFPEQTAIATILSDMDTEIAALETQLAKTRSLKQGMMHNLLTGKIRLI